MPSPVVDDLWHEMLLHTRDYAAFCDAAIGRFLHHEPESAMPPKQARANQSEGLVATLLLARADENCPLDTLPLLFRVDQEVGLDGARRYITDCRGGRSQCYDNPNLHLVCLAHSADQDVHSSADLNHAFQLSTTPPGWAPVAVAAEAGAAREMADTLRDTHVGPHADRVVQHHHPTTGLPRLSQLTSTMAGSGNKTRVKVAQDIQLSGAAAQFGRGMVQDVTSVIMRSFAKCIADDIGRASRGEAPTERKAVPVKGFSIGMQHG
jgi:hypothetical protein